MDTFEQKLAQKTVYAHKLSVIDGAFSATLEKPRQCQRLRFWLPVGLQNRLPRFNSGRGLHDLAK
jgi:hypothetical protein